MTDYDWRQSLHHDGSPAYTIIDQAARRARVRLRADASAPIERAFVRTSPDGEQEIAPMETAGADALCQWWEAQLDLRMPRTNYRFLLQTPQGNLWLSAAGLSRHTPTDATDFALLAGYQAPGWLRDAVFYQIFPDRFSDGDPSNNVRDGEYSSYGRPSVARGWGEPPRPHSQTGGAEFFGGDLQGITERLDYLAELGVSALYLNPIFCAPSNHKYDTTDYEHVDPHLGGDAALIALRRALAERGMRLMLDIAPNHCSAMHPWFLEAQADERAPSAEFFTFARRPDQYATWLGVRSLPKLNYRSERLRERVYAGPDAIMRRWLRPPFQIDGWRVDVANMLARQGDDQLGHKIVRGIRRAVKDENPEAYLLGENFFDGSPHLQGQELDACMNYRGFTFPLLQWLAGRDYESFAGMPWADPQPPPAEALAAQWRAYMAAIPWQIACQQFNILGTHDTPRIMTMLGEDQARALVAATLLFCYPGTPSVYYGDEIGMLGGGDPDCRRCMIWEPQGWNHELRAHYRSLIQLRRSAPALRWGGMQLLYAEGDRLAFQREAPEQRLIVVAQRADPALAALPVRHAGLPDGTRLRELLSGAEATVAGGMLPLHGLAPVGAQIWACDGAA